MSKSTTLSSHYRYAGTWSNLTSIIKTLLTVLSISIFATNSFAQAPIGQSGTAGDFEIDANFKVNNSALKDWRSVLSPSTIFDANNIRYVLSGASNVTGENAFWKIDGNSGSGSTLPEGEVFSGTSNKNGDYIGSGQSPYAITKVNPSAPQKNDVTNIYSRSTKYNNKRWVMLGAETRSVDGTSYIDFEYNQAGVITTSTQLIGLGLQGGRTAKTSTKSGDLLFVVDFSKGGNVPVPKVFEWQTIPGKGGKPDTYSWVELTFPTGVAYIVTNSVDVETAGLLSGFAGDGTPSDKTLALQFVEIGVNLTDLGIPDDNVCAPNATLTVKTRTSSSYTSELKDYSSFKFSIVPSATMDELTSLTKCPTDQAVFEAKVYGSGALGSNVHWYKVTGTAPNEVETEITSGITQGANNASSILTISSVTASNAGKYRAKLTGATCGAPSQDATLTVNETAALTNLTAETKCPSTTGTASFNTTVSGTGASAANVEWYLGTTKLSNGTKYTISTSGSTSTLTINGIAEADEGTYTAKLTGATCGAPEKSSTLTVNETATMQDLSPVTKCPGDGESAIFSATVSGTGASAANVEWYLGTTKLSNGTKYTIATSGSTSTLTINGIAEADEGTYTAKLTGATCGAPEKSSTLTVNPVPSADAGADPADQCYVESGNTFSLDGSKSANGNAKWTVVSKTNSSLVVTFVNGIDNTLTPQVTVSGSTLGGEVVLKLTITSNQTPSCGSDEDEVTIEVKAQVAGPNAEMLPITCADKFFKVKIIGPEAGTTYTITQPNNSKVFAPITGVLNNNTGKVDDVIFEGLVFGDGYRIVASKNGCESAPTICEGSAPEAGLNTLKTEQPKITNEAPAKVRNESIYLDGANTTVTAAPNPYNDRIRFSLRSAISGQGSLELYNLMGQKVKTVYQGFIEKDRIQTIEYSVPNAHRTNLIYMFRVGDQRVSGKLIH